MTISPEQQAKDRATFERITDEHSALWFDEDDDPRYCFIAGVKAGWLARAAEEVATLTSALTEAREGMKEQLLERIQDVVKMSAVYRPNGREWIAGPDAVSTAMRSEINALSPDPGWMDRVKAQARLEEAEWWLQRLGNFDAHGGYIMKSTSDTCTCPQCQRISALHAELAKTQGAPDAQGPKGGR